MIEATSVTILWEKILRSFHNNLIKEFDLSFPITPFACLYTLAGDKSNEKRPSKRDNGCWIKQGWDKGLRGEQENEEERKKASKQASVQEYSRDRG
ncbi:hypothetical protein M0804_007510 [Polistes exclamans]|nr:hypothetical protein M0804_007510 [Polistes exclamans]